MRKGKLIVIDGIDGSGKTTQVDLLSNYLREKNIPFEVISFPRYEDNEYGRLIKRYLEGEFGLIEDVNTYLLSLAYAGDRALAKKEIEKWLRAGKLVIANRYVSSNKAHMGANLPESQRSKFFSWLDKLEYVENRLPKEDLTILLDVVPGIGQSNVQKRGLKDIHEQNLDHEKNAAKIYLELAKAKKGWKVINCMDGDEMKSKQDIQKDILNLIKETIAQF